MSQTGHTLTLTLSSEEYVGVLQGMVEAGAHRPDTYVKGLLKEKLKELRASVSGAKPTTKRKRRTKKEMEAAKVAEPASPLATPSFPQAAAAS